MNKILRILKNIKYKINLHSLVEKYARIELDKGSSICFSGPISMRRFSQIIARKGGKLSIGKNLFLNTNSTITCRSEISIQDDVIIGPNVVLVDHNHDYLACNRSDSFLLGKIEIEKNVWIGANCVILPGTFIGENSVIAANSLVNKQIPSNEIWGGCPAKFIKKIEIKGRN